jgi:5-deoxy-glucuronate isomerase
MADLPVRPSAPYEAGRTIHTTPENVGWGYVGFDVHRPTEGQVSSSEIGDKEHCLVLVAGSGDV